MAAHMNPDHRTTLCRINVVADASRREGGGPPRDLPPAPISRQSVTASDGEPGDRVLPTPEPHTVAGAHSNSGPSSLEAGNLAGDRAAVAGLSIPEGELASHWRGFKRRVAQALRKRRAETFDPITLVKMRLIAATLAVCFAGHFICGLTLISTGRFPLASAGFTWSTFVFGIFFAITMPTLAWQEWLAERDREVRAAVETAVSP